MNRRAERLDRIVEIRQSCAQTGNLELRGSKIRLQMVALGFIHPRIELDQNVPSFHCLPVTNMNGPNDTDFKGLDNLGASRWNDLARRRRDDVNAPQGRPRKGEAEYRHD